MERVTLGPRPTDAARRADITRLRRRATGLLVLAAVVFVVAHALEPRWTWLAFVRATAEASLVGGLADWFAITALFRHPLGLPIPHTAIVRRQKDRIARVLGTFVHNHFLTRDVVEARLRTVDVAQRLGAWLAEPETSRRLASELTTGVARTVDTLPAAEWRTGLVDEGVKLVARALDTSGDAVASALREQIDASVPRWTPHFAREAVHRRVMAGLDRFVHEVATNPAHPTRARLEAALGASLDRWRQTAIAADASGEEPPSAVARALAGLGMHLMASADARRALNDRIIETAGALMEDHGGEVSALIEHTVIAWDADLAAERIELAVGRDLQYIRLNGTLVGGLAGLVIYAISRLF
ncbi:MAG TPA: DUF445 domain-containing protein [Gemmatimonadaceae bacterium]|nr:DUF445 domain-containing protein [Gemmatimonadaceae bacterium]